MKTRTRRQRRRLGIEGKTPVLDHVHVVKNRAKKLRRGLTKHELVFLRRLALANIASFDFQVRVGFYIVDFVFPEKMLIVEIDGKSHEERKQYDEKRSLFLARAGFTVWRIKNEEAGNWPLLSITEYQSPSQEISYQDGLTYAARVHKEVVTVPKAKPPILNNKAFGPYVKQKPAPRPVIVIKASRILEKIFA